MPAPYLLIDFPGGRVGAVIEADALDEAKADLFAGASVRSWESGDPYSGAVTFALADEVAVADLPQYLVVEFPNGAEVGVLEAVYIDPENEATYADTTATQFESGEPWTEP